MLLSSCNMESLTTKNVKKSSRRNSTAAMWSFKIMSKIEDDRVVQVGSQDVAALRQFHRLLKILSVSSQNFIPRHHIMHNNENVLGRGASGIVYKAQYFGTTVALKQLYDPCSSSSSNGAPLGRLQQQQNNEDTKSEESFLEEITKELKLLSNFRHPNIISFLGVVFDTELASKKNSLNKGRKKKVRRFELSSTSIVMEFCPYTLHDLIHETKYQDLWSTKRLVSVVTGMIRGMAFLHSKKVVHRDLKPQNIMLSEAFEVKIVDFGVSKLYVDRKKTMTGYVGTPCYMAPEFIKSDKNVYDGTSADVYSFAIILHELWSRKAPYENIKQHFTIMRKVVAGYRMPMCIASSDSASEGPVFPKLLAELISRSWHGSPEKRPSFATIGRIWRDASLQTQIKNIKTAWFCKNVKSVTLVETKGFVSPIPELNGTTTNSTSTNNSTSSPLKKQGTWVENVLKSNIKLMNEVKKKKSKNDVKKEDTCRVLRVKRDQTGEIGISFDESLNIVAVSEWAKRFGLKVGQRIVECQGNKVSSGMEVAKVCPRDRHATIVLRVRVPVVVAANNVGEDEDDDEQGASLTTTPLNFPKSSKDNLEKNVEKRSKSTTKNVVQCLDGPLELTSVQKDWFDENMKPDGIRRTTTKSLLMAMLVQLQA